MIATALCLTCKHLKAVRGEVPKCDAYPDGIPPEIILAKVVHDKPYAGDHGIQYEPKPRKA